MEAESNAKTSKKGMHTKDAFQKMPSRFNPTIPAMSLTLTSENLHRAPYFDPAIKERVEAQDMLDSKRKGGVLGFGHAPLTKTEILEKFYDIRPTKKDLTPTLTTFHPSLTVLGVQPSLMVA